MCCNNDLRLPMRLIRSTIAAALCAAIALPAFAADATIEGVKFGDVVVGPKLTPDDFKGRVVLVEFWGIR